MNDFIPMTAESTYFCINVLTQDMYHHLPIKTVLFVSDNNHCTFNEGVAYESEIDKFLEQF